MLKSDRLIEKCPCRETVKSVNVVVCKATAAGVGLSYKHCQAKDKPFECPFQYWAVANSPGGYHELERYWKEKEKEK